jgi:uncharacterized protein with PIN domain
VLPPVTEPPTSSRIEQALRAGDSRLLLAEDQTELLQSATQLIQQTRLQQQRLLAQLLDDSTAAALDFGNNSQRVSPLLSTSASPLLVANNGNVLASIATAQNGRALAYGKDLMGQLATASGANQTQLPLFRRSFTWLATGQAQGPLPATLRMATQNYSQASVTNLVARLGSKAEMVSCAITDPANSCWESIDVFVFGQDTPFSASLSNQVSRYLQAGKGVIYLHSNWGDSAGGRQVLQAMGMELGGYAGNYWAPADGYQIGGRTAAQQRQAADRLGAHESALAALKNGSSADFSADTSLIGALDGIRNDLLGQEGQGINLFADNYYLKPYMAAHRRLVLWADLARQQVDYAQVRRSDANTFLRTMAADTLSYAVREHESTPLNFADWMPKASTSLATSDSWETIEVTIAQTDGRTAIGRGAVPGKTVQVQIVDAADAALALRVGNIRTRGNPLAQENYTRPRFPDGHQARLSPGQTLSYSTAWGGPLFLNYSGPRPAAWSSCAFAAASNTRISTSRAIPAHRRSTRPCRRCNAATLAGRPPRWWGRGAADHWLRPKRHRQPPSAHLCRGAPQGHDLRQQPPGQRLQQYECQRQCEQCLRDAGLGLQRQHPARAGVQHFVGWLAACGFLCSGNPRMAPQAAPVGAGGMSWATTP